MKLSAEDRQRNIALLMLFFVSTFNYLDRTILSILQVPIKAELHLSDGQMGALTGLSFALFYATLSLPIARLADRYNRRNLIASSLTVWSSMTALGAFAINYPTLVLCRIGVAVGEAGSIPASQSMIADYYPQSQRATAMALWGLALPTGMTLGYSVTGWLAESFGWRQAFAIIGVAGVLLAPFVIWALKEPMRGRYDPPTQDSEQPLSTKQTLRILWRSPAFCMVTLAVAMHGFTQYSIMNWTVPFYARVHDVPLSTVALYMALLSGIGGSIGMYLGGYLSDWLSKRDIRWRVWVMAFSNAAMIPFCLLQYLAPTLAVSLAAASVASILILCYYGPILAVVHSLVPPNARAFTSAILLLVFNLIGLGLGPFVTGLCSDYLAAQFDLGHDSLRYALALALIPSGLSVVLFIRAAKLLPDTLGRAERDQPRNLIGEKA